MYSLTYKLNNFFPLNRRVKALSFRVYLERIFPFFLGSLASPLSRLVQSDWLSGMFSTPENYNQSRSDSFFPSLAESCRSHKVESPRNYMASSEGCEVRHRFTSPIIKKEICRPVVSATHLLFDTTGYQVV